MSMAKANAARNLSGIPTLSILQLDVGQKIGSERCLTVRLHVSDKEAGEYAFAFDVSALDSRTRFKILKAVICRRFY